MEETNELKNRLRNPIFLSLLFHAVLFVLVGGAIRLKPEWLGGRKLGQISEKRPVFIELSRDQHKNQVVHTDRGREVQTPTEEAFLSDKNRQVDQQQSGQAYVRGGAQKKSHLSHFGVRMFDGGESARGNQQTHSWADQNAEYQVESQDFVKGVQAGDYTALNTKEFIYYSYYQRIRERLDLNWQPILRGVLTKLYRQGRFPADDQEYSTQTIVTLDRRGEIVQVDIIRESGTQSLDQAAVDAFKRAGPFPNPPSGLVDPDGQVKITWDFILKT